MVSVWLEEDRSGKEYRGRRGSFFGAVSVAFAEQLSFCNTHGLIPLLSPVMPLLSPLVMIFVFQVDDINADKNVSSAQIIGESETLLRVSQY